MTFLIFRQDEEASTEAREDVPRRNAVDLIGGKIKSAENSSNCGNKLDFTEYSDLILRELHNLYHEYS